MQDPRNLWKQACFCFAVFLGAFLLFQIEPLIGKIVTPLYGGTASVWMICLLFFQLVLLIGYLLTYFISKLSPSFQLCIYWILLVLPLIGLSVLDPAVWQSQNIGHPIVSLLGMLVVHVAIPCLLLSTISGMMQVWFAISKLGDPYPLYAVSNLGSIGALLTYPTIFEPKLTVSNTITIWSGAYKFLLLIMIICSLIVWTKIKSSTASKDSRIQKDDHPSNFSFDLKQFLQWVFFSATGSTILLSYSSYITNDICPTPLLWVIPLSLYLCTFVLAFSKFYIYPKKLFLQSWPLLFILELLFSHLIPIIGIAINLLLVFVLCMICHSELANRKPAVSQLPTFYLAIASGGAIGGLFVAIVAPILFNFEAERLIVILIMASFTIYELVIKRLQAVKKAVCLGLVLIVLALFFVVCWLKFTSPDIVYRERNFYSAVRVEKQDDCLVLFHGSINHGQQYLDPAKANQVAGHYFGQPQLLIDFLHHSKPKQPLSIGIVGLGVGATAIFGQPHDTITFFELDSKIAEIANHYFSYISHSLAKVNVNIGDGRALLKNLPPQNYDLLIIDAFNGDSIPCHLLTKQAMDIYLKHIKPDGFLLFQTTNTYVDLSPVLGNLAKEMNLVAYDIRFSNVVTYTLLCKNTIQVDKLTRFAANHKDQFSTLTTTPTAVRPQVGVWTDDYNNLITILKF